jgi:hypothetical protein
LSTTDEADALQVARARILAYLERRNVIHIDADADILRVDDALAEREPALAQLAAAAVSGLAPAGPELRRRPVEIAFEGRPGVKSTAPLSVRELGFSLHAATRAGADDEKGREGLLDYILRPPFAMERLLPGPDGLVRIALKKVPGHDVRTGVVGVAGRHISMRSLVVGVSRPNGLRGSGRDRDPRTANSYGLRQAPAIP